MRVPVCVQCRLEMLCDRNSVLVRYSAGSDSYAEGDRFVCVGCSATVVVGITNRKCHYPLLPPSDIRVDCYLEPDLEEQAKRVIDHTRGLL